MPEVLSRFYREALRVEPPKDGGPFYHVIEIPGASLEVFAANATELKMDIDQGTVLAGLRIPTSAIPELVATLTALHEWTQKDES